MIFSFSLCTASLLATLVIYFRMGLGDIADGKLLESSKLQNYILSMLFKVVI